jgi:virginiamycin B lyase
MNAISRRTALGMIGAVAAAASAPTVAATPVSTLQSWPLATPRPTGIHDVAPAPDGGVWFSAQRSGHLGWFDPKTARVELIALGSGSSPHGVIQGPDRAAWLTDSGLNAIVRVGWPDRTLRVYPLPAGTPYANLNTATFDAEGDLWFTGQSGIIGKLATKTGSVTVKNAPRGVGPYGICTTPAGEVWYCSLAGSYIARIERSRFEPVVVEPPNRGQGARRVWSDSRGRLWVSEWLAGNLSVHDPTANTWRGWRLPGERPQPYAVYVDPADQVWVSDFGANAVWRFDPASEQFERHALARQGANVRQIHGRQGEVWLPESGTEHLSLIRTS